MKTWAGFIVAIGAIVLGGCSEPEPVNRGLDCPATQTPVVGFDGLPHCRIADDLVNDLQPGCNVTACGTWEDRGLRDGAAPGTMACAESCFAFCEDDRNAYDEAKGRVKDAGIDCPF